MIVPSVFAQPLSWWFLQCPGSQWKCSLFPSTCPLGNLGLRFPTDLWMAIPCLAVSPYRYIWFLATSFTKINDSYIVRLVSTAHFHQLQTLSIHLNYFNLKFAQRIFIQFLFIGTQQVHVIFFESYIKAIHLWFGEICYDIHRLCHSFFNTQIFIGFWLCACAKGPWQRKFLLHNSAWQPQVPKPRHCALITNEWLICNSCMQLSGTFCLCPIHIHALKYDLVPQAWHACVNFVE